MFHHFTEHVNWLSLLLGALAYFMLGAIWYGPLFSKAWVRLSGINMEDPNIKKGVAATMITSFVFMALSCVGLTVFRQLIPMNSYADAFHLAVLIGICFSTPAVSIGYLYTKKPLGLYFIDCSYHLLGLIAASMIMQYFG